jgi:hypothetical protein
MQSCHTLLHGSPARTHRQSSTKQSRSKLNTKVLSAEKNDGKVVVMTEAAKDGKQEKVRISQFSFFQAWSVIETL